MLIKYFFPSFSLLILFNFVKQFLSNKVNNDILYYSFDFISEKISNNKLKIIIIIKDYLKNQMKI